MKESRVGGGEVHLAVSNRRRTDNPGAFVVEGPPLFTCLRIERIEVGVPAAEEHHPTGNGGRGLDTDLVVNDRVGSCLEMPFVLAALGVQSIKVGVPATDVQNAVSNRWRSVDDISGVDAPLWLPCRHIERVNEVVPASEVDGAVPNDRRGEVCVKRIRHDLGGRFCPMKAPTGVSPLAASLKSPLQSAAIGVHRIKIAVEAAEIDDAVIDRRRGGDPAASLELPFEDAGISRDGVEVVIVATEVDRVPDHRRGGKDLAARMKGPLHPIEVWYSRSFVN